MPLRESHGFKDASSDPAIVGRMPWQIDGEPCNIGVATGKGLVVLDVDCKGDKNGWVSLAAVGITPESLASLNTYTVTTPTGGRHFWFYSDDAVSTGTDVLGLGSGVDVRGEGGFIVVPPSRRPVGPYVVSSYGNACDAGDNLPRLSKLANWSALGGKIQRPVPPPPPPRPSIPISDAEMRQRMDRAKAYLRKCKGAVSGQGGHDRTFSIASTLVNGFLLPSDIALDLLLTDFNPRCSPPWAEKDLRHKVGSAGEKGPPEGKSYGWLLGPDATSEDGDISVVELPELDEEAEETSEVAEEAVEAVLFPPGIVGTTAKWIFDRCEKPHTPFATIAALTVWATLVARKVRFQNQGPVLYGLHVTATSNGKASPLELARTILEQIGVSSSHLYGRVSSWNAGVEVLLRCWQHPAVLSIVDEAAGYFNMGRKSDFGLMDFQKASWSRSQGTLDPQARTKKTGSLQLSSIHRPSLSMLLAAQPRALGDAVRSSQLEDGLLPRVIWAVRPKFNTEIIEAALNRSRNLDADPEGNAILDRGKTVWNCLLSPDSKYQDMATLEACPNPVPGKDPPVVREEVWRVPIAVYAGDEVQTLFSDFTRRTQERIQPAAEGRAGPHGFLWGKAAENAKRVALVLAAARCIGTNGTYYINPDEARWAIRFVEASVQSGIRWVQFHLADTPFQQRVNRVLGVIASNPDGITRRALIRTLRHTYPKRDVDEALESLGEAGSIVTVDLSTKGRPATLYRATGRKRARSGT